MAIEVHFTDITANHMPLDCERLLKPVKKLRKLVRSLDSRPAPDEVHDLRTSSRRIEAAVEALSLNTRRVGKSVMKDLRRCRKRAGKVRDMDVLTEYASTVHLNGEEECSVRLLEHLGAQRKKHASRLYAEIRRVRSPLRKNLRQTETILSDLLQDDASATSGNAAGTAVTLATQLAEPQRLHHGNLHPYRLKVKELRNILQLAAGHSSRFADDLAKVKDAIGEWHDWEELVSIARKELNHGNRCGFLAELKNITQRKYQHALNLAQSLRRNYLRSATPSDIPREPVWEAIARLAG